MALIASASGTKQYEVLAGQWVLRSKGWFAFLVFIPLVVAAGTRSFWFADTVAYVRTFNNMPTTSLDLPLYYSTLRKDKAYYISVALLKLMIGESPRTYLWILAIIQGMMLAAFFRRYSHNLVISYFLFIFSVSYISWMYNGVRQFLAVCITLFATGPALKKKYIPAILIIVFASLFHRSALMMIPCIIIAQGEVWNKKTVLFILSVIMGLTFLSSFTGLLNSMLEDTQYSGYLNVVGDDGTNPIRVAVFIVPAVLSFIGKDVLRKEGGVLMNYCANMSIIAAGIYFVSVATSGITVGRLPIYCNLFGFVLLPWELDHIFGKSLRPLVYAAMVILYALYYYIQVHLFFGLF